MQDLILAQPRPSWPTFLSLPFSVKFSFVEATGVAHMQSTCHSPRHTAATQRLRLYLAEERDEECELKGVSQDLDRMDAFARGPGLPYAIG